MVQPHDPSLSVPPSAPGYAVPPFSSFPGPGLQPTMPSTGLPFSFSAGNALPHTAAFSGEYGISGVPERPKKVSFCVHQCLNGDKNQLNVHFDLLVYFSGFSA